jgi:hypothetical protein
MAASAAAAVGCQPGSTGTIDRMLSLMAASVTISATVAVRKCT